MFRVISIIILILAFPIGYLLAWLTRDELVSGRKWFITLGIASLVVSLILAFCNIDVGIKFSVIVSLFFIAIVSFVSVYMSYKSKFVK